MLDGSNPSGGHVTSFLPSFLLSVFMTQQHTTLVTKMNKRDKKVSLSVCEPFFFFLNYSFASLFYPLPTLLHCFLQHRALLYYFSIAYFSSYLLHCSFSFQPPFSFLSTFIHIRQSPFV